MKNIRVVLLGEVILLIVICLFNILMGGWGLSSIRWFLDLSSLVLIIIVLISGLLIMGIWKDFIKSFSVGIKKYSLLELKNIIGAVDFAQKIASETIGLRLKKIVATTAYAPADRFLRIELSRVFEATIYGFSILKLLN